RQNYGHPSESDINNYGTELALLLRDGYVAKYEFGFQIGDERLLCWRYTVVNSDLAATDDRPGGIISGIDVTKAVFYNQLTLSSTWAALNDEDRERIKAGLPIQRVVREGPKDGRGYWQENERQYSSNGVSLPRATFRPY